jgi:hypothetical protein
MKRRNFFRAIGIGAVASVAPSLTIGQKQAEQFNHDPIDYSLVPEELEEDQEYEIDVPEHMESGEIVWS